MATISMDELDLGRDHDDFEGFVAEMKRSFSAMTKDGEEPLFQTNAKGLYDLFLENLPENARQYYNCFACRSFVSHYGGLVTINKNGTVVPVFWHDAPAFFKPAADAVFYAVKKATVTGVFLTSQKILGTKQNGGWDHLYVDVPANVVYKALTMTAGQKSAEKREDFKMLYRAFKKYDIPVVQTAIRLLESEAMYRTEKVIGVANWFYGVLKSLEGKRNKTNLMWKAVATAPAGFCHVSSSMIGTLLDDIKAGYDFNTVSKRFAEKMNPLQYQRPQAAPAAGTVERAEKIVERMGIAKSLERRFARVEELKTIWRPATASAPTTDGVFAGMRTKNTENKFRDMKMPVTVMTWTKFERTVLPNAKKIEFLVPGKPSSYGAICTAVHADAPAIIQWDNDASDDLRNPFSWYVYGRAIPANMLNLKLGYVDVTAVTLQPSMWNPGYAHQGKSVFFILDGCKDTNYNNCGCGLFPEILKSELHEIRSVIEEYSRTHHLTGFDKASACGIRLNSNNRFWDYTFRVTTDLGVSEYKLDRWD